MILFSPRKDYFCPDWTEMDLKVWISLLSVTLCTVLSAPAAEMRSAPAAASPQRHVRNKRCSCATFLDKECVYFCHLDIIWVNTPERVVSYGLGNAPRSKRAVSSSTTRAPRCRCLRGDDGGCANFCLRSEAAAAAGARRGDAAGPDRTEGVSAAHRVGPAAPRAVLRTRLLLEKWAARRRHRARAWQGESTTP